MLKRRTAFAVTTALLLAVGCAPPAENLPVAPTSVVSQFTKPVAPDFDGDGLADVVFGVGDTVSQVVIHYGNGRIQHFDRDAANGPRITDLENTRGFGAGVLARDLNLDGVTDLVVVDETVADPGAALYLIPGSAQQGLLPERAVRYSVPGAHGTPALVTHGNDRMLLVAAYQADTSLLIGHRLNPDGQFGGDPLEYRETDFKVTPQVGDGFGETLAASDDRLLVGLPRRRVDAARDVGAVLMLRYNGGQELRGSLIVGSELGAIARASSRFGSALAAGLGGWRSGHQGLGTAAGPWRPTALLKISWYPTGSGRLSPMV